MESSQITLDKLAAEELAAPVGIRRISAGRATVVAARERREDINITGLFTCGWVSAFRYLGPGDGAEKPRSTIACFRTVAAAPVAARLQPENKPRGPSTGRPLRSSHPLAFAPFGRAVDKTHR